jgi:hypothetical protein
MIDFAPITGGKAIRYKGYHLFFPRQENSFPETTMSCLLNAEKPAVRSWFFCV